MNPSKSPSLLFWLCLTVVIITPFSSDVFIAAFPKMRVFFDTDHITLVISVFLAGLALAQPIYGPLLDRFGRKPVLVIGLIIYVVATGIILWAHTFELLLAARFMQALGACSTIVTAFAMLRDTQKKEQLIHSMGNLMAIIGVCPAIAPLLGAVLTEWLGWRGGFIFLWIVSILYLAIITLFFRETILHKNKDALNWHNMTGSYARLFKDYSYRTYCIISALSYGTLFTFFGLSSIYLIGLFGFSLLAFGWLVFLNGVIILAASLSVPRLSKRLGLARVSVIGTTILLSGGVLMLLANEVWGANTFTFVLPMAIVTLGIGFIRPTASAGAMTQAPGKLAGSASAGFNFASYVGGAACSAIGGLLVASPLYFSILVVILGLAALCFALTHQRQSRQVA